jgi:Homeodomain-like domain
MGKFSPNKFPVFLDDEQRARLEKITRDGRAPARKITHARVLLLSDHNRSDGHWKEPQIAKALGIHRNCVSRVRKRFVLEGEVPAVDRKRRETPPVAAKIDGRVEAHLVAICCGPPPDGRTVWTMQLLADELVRRGLVTSISDETVRVKLKKTNCSPGASSRGASPSGMRRGSSRRWKTSSISTTSRIRKKNR